MATRLPGWTLAELAERLGASLDGPGELRVERPVPAGQSDPQGLTFAGDAHYLAKVEASEVGAVLLPPDFPTTKPALRTPHPREAFAHFLGLCVRPLPLDEGVHPLAVVDPDAQVDPTARIGPYAVVERGARVGPAARIFPFVYVGEDCDVGEGATLLPHSVLVQSVRIGARAVVHPGAVLGADGFGFVWDGKRQRKVPQVGSVEIGPDVEVGANSTVDRATMGQTVLAEGVKLDNLVQVAHNVRIGPHSVLASLVGIGGSARLGARNTLAGQAAVADHLELGDDVTLAGRAGATKDLPQAGVYWGLPAVPIRERMRLDVQVRRLPDLAERVKELERRLAELEGRA